MTDNCNHIHGACDPGAPGGEHVFACTLPKGHDGNHVDLTWGHMTDTGPVADDYCIWEWAVRPDTMGDGVGIKLPQGVKLDDYQDDGDNPPPVGREITDMANLEFEGWRY